MLCFSTEFREKVGGGREGKRQKFGGGSGERERRRRRRRRRRRDLGQSTRKAHKA
jgi:hypothetical protein